MIPIVRNSLGTVTKKMEELEISGRIETILTTAIRLSRLPKKSWRPETTYCHSDSCERSRTTTSVRKLTKRLPTRNRSAHP